ncbi:MAG: hypothetical protein ACOX8S_09920 [Christensenellales bacterium]|jgi:hypothetical protein
MKMFEKLKKIKNGEWILLLFAVGILLVYFSSGGSGASGNADEARLAKVLSGIEGAGNVQVFISYNEQEGSVYAFSSDEKKTEGSIKGVVIVASGAGDAAVRLRLAEAARVALGVDAAAVSVYKMDKKK